MTSKKQSVITINNFAFDDMSKVTDFKQEAQK